MICLTKPRTNRVELALLSQGQSIEFVNGNISHKGQKKPYIYSYITILSSGQWRYINGLVGSVHGKGTVMGNNVWKLRWDFGEMVLQRWSKCCLKTGFVGKIGWNPEYGWNISQYVKKTHSFFPEDGWELAILLRGALSSQVTADKRKSQVLLGQFLLKKSWRVGRGVCVPLRRGWIEETFPHIVHGG